MRSITSTLTKHLPDGIFLRILYYRQLREWLNLRNPETFGDYIQWIKLNGGLERYAKYADKYTVREFVERTIGKQYLIPLLGVWDSFDAITFKDLPDRFALKGTHGCGYNYICKDKSTIDMESLKEQANGWLAENFYKREREIQYRDCRPRLIAEKYLENKGGQLTDYKIYCSKGQPRAIQVNNERFSGNMTDELFDLNWHNFYKSNKLDNSTFKTSAVATPKPAQLTKMLEIATKLSKDFPFVRVDLYVVEGKIYFGELTFTPGSGLVSFKPKKSGSQEFVKIIGIDLAAYA